jgi:hypothetical protein
MIRWYDYVAAFLVADFITTTLFSAINALINPEINIWWAVLPILACNGWYSVIWSKWYTKFRLIQEISHEGI